MKFNSALLALALTGCDGGSDTPDPDLINCDGSQCLSIETFGDNIAADLSGSAVGWSYVIYYQGEAEKWDSGGDWRTEVDPPQVSADIYSPFNMGSIGKTITTIGTMLAMDASSAVDVDDPISGWLPPDWTIGDGVEGITFADLMRHESGLRLESCTYVDMKAAIALGINESDYGVEQYNNMNFCLLRVLLPYINGYSYTAGGTTDETESVTTAQAYVDYIQQNVFTPAGLPIVSVVTPEVNPTLAYTFPDPGIYGVNPGVITMTYDGVTELELTGAGTWHPSPLDLARLMWTVEHTADVIDPTLWQTIKDRELGLYAAQVTGGTAYHHNGKLNYVGDLYPKDQMAGLRAVYYILPGDLVAVVTYNSVDYPDQTTESPNAVLVGAYEEAWEDEPSGSDWSSEFSEINW